MTPPKHEMRPYVVWALPASVVACFVTLVILFAGLLAGFGTVIAQNRTTARQGKQAHDGLCVFKVDLAARVKVSATYLRLHPGGIPGFPASIILSSVTNQRKTLAALSKIRCTDDEATPQPKPATTAKGPT